jgi:hypothetical protein
MIEITDPMEEMEESAEEILPEQEIDEVVEQEDGSAVISLDDLEEGPQMFDGNLAEHVSSSELSYIADDLIEAIERDQKAREKRDKQYEEGLRRTGLGDDAPGGAQFSGASRVVHPILAEACVDFSARAIKELFPAGGPVKIESDGELNQEEEKQAVSLRKCLNEQFVRKMPEYRRVFEQKLTQLPLGGSQFTKFYYDASKGRIRSEFVPIDDIFLPYYADSFYDAERVTHRQYLVESDYRSRVESGQYLDTAILAATDPEFSSSKEANDKIEGKERDGYNEDGARIVYEVYTWLEIDDDEFTQGVKAPYIVSIDEYDQKVLSIYRNWEEQDITLTKLDWIVEDIFITWRGAYGIGGPHLIGGLSAAATGSLRALLDSAHINNAPTLLKLKASRISGQNQTVAVTQIADIEGPVGIDDIRKHIMPMPFNQPSPVLFQLLGWLTDAAKGVVSTASEKIADATSNTPVGTVQALIEQGAVIFSSIHSRLHYSQAKAFEIVLRLLKTYQPQELQKFGVDPQAANLINVRPVSDPQIFSEAQRFAQMQGVLQLAASDPEMAMKYNKVELHRSMLMLMKVNNVDRILPPPPQPPQPVDPAGEMIAWMQGKPVAVAPQMDHMAHIMVHMNYLRNSMYGRNPVMVPITAKVLDHLGEHLGYFMAMRLANSVQQSQMEAQQVMQMGGIPAQIPPETLMAQESANILGMDDEIAFEAVQLIEEIAEFVRINGPQDPNMASVKMTADIQRMDIERQRDKDLMEAKLKSEAEMRRAEGDAMKLQLDERKLVMAQMAEQIRSETSKNIEEMRQMVELRNNEEDNRIRQMTELMKNEDDNRTRLLVEKMKGEFTAFAQSLNSDKEQKDKEESPQLKQIEKMLQQAEATKQDDRLGVIMEGLKEAIASARQPRVTTAMRDENGELIGARSELA